MIGGFTWYEECFAGAFLVGNFPKKKIENKDKYFLLFSIFMVYLISESIRGLFVLESIRKIRWPIFFLILLLLLYKSNEKQIRESFDKDLSYSVTLAGLIFHIIYVCYGIFAEFMGFSRYDAQAAMIGAGFSNFWGGIWGHVGYVNFLFLLVVPAAFITVFSNKDFKKRRVGWITLIFLFFTAYFYDSRVTGVYLLGVLVIMLRYLKKEHVMVLGCSVLCLFIVTLFMSFADDHAGFAFYLENLFESGGSIWASDEHLGISRRDLDRKIYLMSIYPALTETWHNFLFGYGFRSSGYVVAPHAYDLAMFFRYGRSMSPDNITTEAITNLSVDCGVVGLGLLLTLTIWTAIRLYRLKGRFRIIIIYSLFGSCFWMFATNTVDILVLYILFMPSGILFHLDNKMRPFIVSSTGESHRWKTLQFRVPLNRTLKLGQD